MKNKRSIICGLIFVFLIDNTGDKNSTGTLFCVGPLIAGTGVLIQPEIYRVCDAPGSSKIIPKHLNKVRHCK